MALRNLIHGEVLRHPELSSKLKKAASRKTPYQYVYQTLNMTFMSFVTIILVLYLFTSSNMFYFFIGLALSSLLLPFIYKFWFGVVDVWINKESRNQDSDLLFVSEYFLVMLESGLPLGNALKGISKLDRPGGKFFNRVFAEVRAGKDLESALDDASQYAASDTMKTLLKRLRDSLRIGVDLREVLNNFIEEASEKKLLEIRKYSKRLNPIVMMYLLMGIVVPSLGMTFFILAATLMEIGPDMLKIILIFLFLIMFAFQYFAYSLFKFTKTSI